MGGPGSEPAGGVAGGRVFLAVAALSILALTVVCAGCYLLSRLAELKAAEGRVELPGFSIWLFTWDWLLWIVPAPFVAVGLWYERFAQVSDEEVLACLRRGREGSRTEGERLWNGE